MNRTELEQLIASLCRDDDQIITPDELDNAFDLALNRINQDAPGTQVIDVAANSAWSLALPAGFDEEFSELVSVEYPLNERPRSYLQGVCLYQEPTGKVLELPYQLSGTLRVSFTIKHEIDDTSSTLKAEQQEAFASYVAALLCEQLATYYSHDSSSTLQADTIDHASKADKFRRRARDLRNAYTNQVKPKLANNQSASAVVSLGSRRRRR